MVKRIEKKKKPKEQPEEVGESDIDEKDFEREISDDDSGSDDVKIEDEDVELSRFDYDQALQAIKAIQEYANKHDSKKSALFDDDQILDLDVVMKKYPRHLKPLNFIDTCLPHPFHDSQTTSTCIFVRDIDKKLDQDREKSVRFYKDLFDENGLTEYTKVMSVSQLLTEYKQYIDLKRLCGAYDLFLADKRLGRQFIYRLGRHFIEAKKFPFKLEVMHNVKKNFNRVFKLTRAVLTPSTLKFKVKIGRLNQPAEHLLENLKVITENLARRMPGKWASVRSCYVALNKICELPVYVDWGSMNEIKFPQRKKLEPSYVDGELTTLRGGGKIRVYDDGTVSIGKRGEKKKLKRESVWNPVDSCYAKKAQAKKRKAIQAGNKRYPPSKKAKRTSDSKDIKKKSGLSSKGGKTKANASKPKRQRLDKSLVKVKVDDDIALENIG